MQSDGMDLAALEQALREEPDARCIYTIPNFQNPSGITMSLEKRKALYALAKQYGVLILEDNPYGDLRVSGQDLPCIKSFDEEGLVIYAGSFSKVISPGPARGLRLRPEGNPSENGGRQAGAGRTHQYFGPDALPRLFDRIRPIPDIWPACGKFTARNRPSSSEKSKNISCRRG